MATCPRAVVVTPGDALTVARPSMAAGGHVPTGMHMLHHEASADETALQVHTDACRATRFHSRSISRAGGLPAVLARFRQPTLLLWGEHDVTAVPERLLPRLLTGHPHRQGGIVAGAGHWAQYEAAAQVNERLRAFFLSEPAT